MQNFNTERKPLSELVEEAEKKNMKLVLVADPIIDGHQRVKVFIESEHFMVVMTSDLSEEDQKSLPKMMEEAKPFNFTIKAPEPLPNIIIEEEATEFPKLNATDVSKLKIPDINKRAPLPNTKNHKKMLRSHRKK